MKIKDLKPGSDKFYQGYYKLKNPEKYIGDPNKIIYRSSWEFNFCKYCDTNKNIIKWSSEPIPIPYISPIDNKEHQYYVDFYLKVLNRNNEIEEFFAEIKPSSQLKKPILLGHTRKNIKKFNEEAKTWLINNAKFKAANSYAKNKNAKFVLITEKFLFGNNFQNKK